MCYCCSSLLPSVIHKQLYLMIPPLPGKRGNWPIVQTHHELTPYPLHLSHPLTLSLTLSLSLSPSLSHPLSLSLSLSFSLLFLTLLIPSYNYQPHPCIQNAKTLYATLLHSHRIQDDSSVTRQTPEIVAIMVVQWMRYIRTEIRSCLVCYY